MAEEEEKPNNKIWKAVWNEEKSEFLGRNGIGWCKLCQLIQYFMYKLFID